MELKKISSILKDLNIDSYLIYDFRGSNHVGRGILNFHHQTTRRWVAIITSLGKVTYIIPKLEESIFSDIKENKITFITHEEFENAIKKSIINAKTIALDYSPNSSLPIIDVIPAGFKELVNKLNPKATLVSSADLTQYLSARWGNEGYKTHKDAAKVLKEANDKALSYIKNSLAQNKKITDLDVEEFILNFFKKENMICEHNVCIVSTNNQSSNPHYWPTKEKNYPIKKNSVLLFDIWVRSNKEKSIYADCTFMAWIGPDPIPKKVQKAWGYVRDARKRGVEYIKENIDKNLKGFQVDDEVRKVIENANLGEYFVHRTGHSIDTNDHGSGANIDNYETHDSRLILPDTGFSIEPGIYLSEFGIRSEINVYIHPDKEVEVTTYEQEELFVI